MASNTKLEFPCLSMDVNQWFSGSKAADLDQEEVRSVAGDVAAVREALKNFLLDPLMLDEEEEEMAEEKSSNNNPWLLHTNTNKSAPASSINSSGSSTPKPLTRTALNNIMAPVLKETSRDYWLANEDNKNTKEEMRAPVSDRVPNPNTSLWLAASTASISSQTAANNITWPHGSIINSTPEQWLSGSQSEECKPSRNWLTNWINSNSGSDWLNAPANSGCDWLSGDASMTSSTSSINADWLEQGRAERCNLMSGSAHQDWLVDSQPKAKPGHDWVRAKFPMTIAPVTSAMLEAQSEDRSWLSTPASEQETDWLLQDAQEEEKPLSAPKRPHSPAIEAWLDSEFDDSESSIVVLSDDGGFNFSDLREVAPEAEADEEELGFWLL